MYVFIGDATYQQLSPLGVPNKVLEVGTTNLENKSVFSFNLNAVNTERMPNEFYLTEKNEEIKDEDDIINKKC